MYDEIELQKMEKEEAAKILKQAVNALKEIRTICTGTACENCPYGKLSYLDDDDGTSHYACAVDDSCSVLGADLPFEWKFEEDVDE